MGQRRRVERRLRVEELEPRVAPVFLSIGGLTTYDFFDANRDWVRVTLSGGVGQVEILDSKGRDPVRRDIGSINFLAADSSTSLDISIRAASGDGHSPGGRVTALGLTVGSLTVPGPISGLTASRLNAARIDGAVTGTMQLATVGAGDRIEVAGDLKNVVIAGDLLGEIVALNNDYRAITLNEAPNGAHAVNQQFVINSKSPTVVISGNISPASEKDTYQFTAKAGDRIYFDLDAQQKGSPLDAELNLYRVVGAGQVLVATNNNYHGLDPFIDYTFATAGAYRIEVQSRGAATTGSYDLWAMYYRLKVDAREAGDIFSDGQIIGALPAVVSGSMDDQWDQDFYRFTVAAGQKLTFDLDAQLLGSNLSGALILYDAAGNVLAQGVTGGDPAAPLDPIIQDYTFATGGTYGIEVRGDNFHSRGYYKLYISGDPLKYQELESNDSRETAQAITPPVVIAGSMAYDEDRDFFRFAAAAGQRLVFDVETAKLGSSLDSELVLRDAAGNALAFSDNSTMLDPFIDYTFGVAGNYSIEIRSHNAASSGEYLLYISESVTAITEVEPNDDRLVNAQVIGNRPVAISGAISSITDVDYYRFQASGGQTLWFDLDSLYVGGTLVAGLYLYDAAGLLVSSDPGTSDPDIVWTFTAPGLNDYWIGVQSNATEPRTTGSYLLNIWDRTEEGDSNNEIAKAEVISTPVIVNGTIEPNSDVDFYAFVVAANDELVFDIDAQAMGSPVDLELNIYNALGAVIASNGGVTDDPFPLDPLLQYKFTLGGTYYVEVKNGNALTGPYRLFIHPPNAQLKNPEFRPNHTWGTAISVGGLATQPAIIQGSLSDSTDSDWYRFDARIGETYTIDVDADILGSTLNPKISMWLGTRFGAVQIIGGSNGDEETGLFDPFLTYTIPATQGIYLNGTLIDTVPGNGTYFVKVQSSPAADGTGIGGDYRLYINRVTPYTDVERMVDNAAPRSMSTYLRKTAGVTITGSLSSAGDIDRYTFSGEAGEVITWNVNNTNAVSGQQPLLVIYSDGDEVLAKSTNTNLADPNPYIQFTIPKTGGYRVEISSLGGWTGDYTLSATWQTIDHTDLFEGQPILLKKFPDTLVGNISAAGQMDTYLFKVTHDTVLSFEVTRPAGSALDSVLQIVDMSGRLVVSNEDFAGDVDAVLSHRFAKGGTYGVIVAGEGASTGAYNLRITRTPSNLGGLNVGGDVGATGLLSLTGSLVGAARVSDDVDGRVEFGLDIAAPLNIGGDLGGGEVFAGGVIQKTGQIYIAGRIDSDGLIFTRGAIGSPGSGAPLRVDGDILGELVVALPGTVTGKARVFPIDNGFTPAPGGLEEVTLYNLDGTGRLTGPFVNAMYYTGDHVIRPERDNYDFTDITPTVGPVLGTPQGAFSQAEAYWQIDRYHAYMMLLGFGNVVNRSLPIFVDHPATQIQDNAFYDPNNWWIRTGTSTSGDPVRLGESGAVILHEYNHAVTDDLIRAETEYLSTPFDQTGAVAEGMSDYRANSFLDEPRFSWNDPKPGISLKNRITDNFYLYDPNNVNTDLYKQGSILSGPLWDLRQLLGPTVVDTLSMAALPGLGKMVRNDHPDPTLPELLNEIIKVDNRIFGGMHLDAIQQAFGIHRIYASVPYNFEPALDAAGNPLPFYIVNPSSDVPPFGANTISQTVDLGAMGNWRVEFDSLITKIAEGDRLRIKNHLGVVVLDYVPDWSDPPTTAPPVDFGRGLQGPDNAFTVLGTDEITIELIIGDHPEEDLQVSFGFKVTNITAV